MTKTTLTLVLKIIESIAWVLGPALFVLNLFSFKASKVGFYYESTAEWGMAIGVMIISIAYVSRFWRK